MTPDDFREIVLALDGAEEGAHMGHPDFRANGRIFASLHSQDRFGMVKVTPEEQAVLLREHPGTFEPSPGAWGRQGCTNVRLAMADRRAVKAAARLAWEGILRLPPPRPRKPAARRAATVTRAASIKGAATGTRAATAPRSRRRR